ncbi:MAG: aspartyl/glutamyl-tRNA amidotransferase subunit A [Candidatus Micrarchaeota archaeon]|nr:aspartyl/glutamyl-tRNA amidotransferase subunit A [Candidatus Micrarchaeota archaeon]
MLIATVRDYLEAVKSGEIKAEDFLPEAIQKAERIQKAYSPFITIDKKARPSASKGPLYGLPVSIKDSICTNGMQTTAGSKILEGYIPPFDATCVTRIKDSGAAIIGKTAMDEFGFGTFSTNCAYGAPKNPLDIERSCGGSSGGAGCITAAADFPHIAIAQSTGGSITAPAAFTGTVGLTPTYGRVSRYGLIDYSNSMDKIGVISKCVYDSALMLSVISGHDPLDSTSSEVKSEDFTKHLNSDVKGMKIALPKEYFSSGIDPKIAKLVRDKAERLQQLGAKVEDVSLPLTKYAMPAYYMIALSEASTNLAKFCGLRYGLQKEIQGNFDEYFSKIRTEGFGEEAKRRIIFGTYARMAGYRDAYYLKAFKVRARIIDEFKKTFAKYDALITPSMPILPPKFSDISKLSPIQIYNMDIMTTAPNMAGMPTLSVPIGKIDGLPVGMQIISNHFMEGKTIAIGAKIEELK